MGYFSWITIAFATLMVLGCSSREIAVSQTVSRSHPVLEVVTTAYGLTYPKQGDILHMRLFVDGRFEYDDFPDYDPPHFTGRNVEVFRKEAQLNPKALRELIGMAERPDLLSANDAYPYSGPRGLDTRWDLTVRIRHNGKEKSIFAEDYWFSLNRVPPTYPHSMVELVERVEELKATAIGKRSSQWATPKSTIR